MSELNFLAIFFLAIFLLVIFVVSIILALGLMVAIARLIYFLREQKKP